jgi:hypothetical protein
MSFDVGSECLNHKFIWAVFVLQRLRAHTIFERPGCGVCLHFNHHQPHSSSLYSPPPPPQFEFMLRSSLPCMCCRPITSGKWFPVFSEFGELGKKRCERRMNIAACCTTFLVDSLNSFRSIPVVVLKNEMRYVSKLVPCLSVSHEGVYGTWRWGSTRRFLVAAPGHGFSAVRDHCIGCRFSYSISCDSLAINLMQW